MSRIRSHDTSIEIAVRRFLYSQGYRYRLNYPLPGRPDIVFPGKKTAVFINGCFWHMHGCSRSTIPSTRREFWEKKLRGNAERDISVASMLADQGWKVVTLWECDIMRGTAASVSPLISIIEDEG